jgi:hypothetical protein
VRTSARALAWEFRPHRWGLLAVAAYAVALTVMRFVNASWSEPVADPGVARFLGGVAIPLSVAAFYLLAAFSFGFTGDLAARRSMYPPRLFTLPVTTAALAGWPMAYGTAGMALLGLAACVAPWPGFDLPFWAALLAAVVMAWMQALTWTPYPMRGLRILAAVGLLTAMDIVFVVGIELEAADALMVALLAPQLPLAYVVARAGVARARCGDVPEWRGPPAALRQVTSALRHRRRPFATSAEAQRWSEWRRHGWSLPVWVAMVLPFASALLFLDGGTGAFVVITLVVMLLTPPVMAAFVGVTLARADPGAGGAHGVSPFLATRPLTSAAIVGAKLHVALLTTLAAWLLIGIAIPLALGLSETWPVVADRARRVRDVIGMPRTVVLALLTLGTLVAATWARLVLGMYVGLGGRPWLVRTHLGANLAFVAVALPLLDWIAGNDDVLVALWNAAPWIAGVLVAVKVAAAGWVTARLEAAGLLARRTLIGGAAAWLLGVTTLYALLVWIAATPFIPRYGLMLVAILVLPFARLYAAPLALAWNRHR